MSLVTTSEPLTSLMGNLIPSPTSSFTQSGDLHQNSKEISAVTAAAFGIPPAGRSTTSTFDAPAFGFDEYAAAVAAEEAQIDEVIQRSKELSEARSVPESLRSVLAPVTPLPQRALKPLRLDDGEDELQIEEIALALHLSTVTREADEVTRMLSSSDVLAKNAIWQNYDEAARRYEEVFLEARASFEAGMRYQQAAKLERGAQ